MLYCGEQIGTGQEPQVRSHATGFSDAIVLLGIDSYCCMRVEQ